MAKSQYFIALSSSIAILALAAACGSESGGGSEGDTSGGTGGSSSSVGGPVTVGGTSGGTQGSTTTTGTAGSAGSAAAPRDADCPAAAPSDGETCASGNGFLVCPYDSTSCTCTGGFGTTEPAWRCLDAVCPDSQPNDGAGCMVPELSCAFGAADCLCTMAGGRGGFGGLQWDCGGDDTATNPATCPNGEPNDGDDCTGDVALECSYMASDCVCEGQGGDNAAWSCTNSADSAAECPTPPPNDGSVCFGFEGLSCDYDAGSQTCSCDAGGGGGFGGNRVQWSCSGESDATTAADCPAEQPSDGDECSGAPAALCNYGDGGGCLCTSGGIWLCF